MARTFKQHETNRFLTFALMVSIPVTALVAVIWRPPCDEVFTRDAYVKGNELGLTARTADTVWIEANLSEFQRTHVRVGQRALLVAEAYGDRVTYEGTVVGYAPRSNGFASSSSRNALTIERRPPLRIDLVPQQLVAHPLPFGSSIQVKIDTSDRSGAALTISRARERRDSA